MQTTQVQPWKSAIETGFNLDQNRYNPVVYRLEPDVENERRQQRNTNKKKRSREAKRKKKQNKNETDGDDDVFPPRDGSLTTKLA